MPTSRSRPTAGGRHTWRRSRASDGIGPVVPETKPVPGAAARRTRHLGRRSVTPTARLLALSLALSVAACGASSAAGETSVAGEVHLAGRFVPGVACEGVGTTAAVRAGAPIYVEATDVQGPVATGRLGAGTAASESVCVFPYVVEGIPRGFEEYRVVLGEFGRGVLGMTQHLRERDLSRPVLVGVPAD